MRDFLSVGSTPPAEDCEQIGTPQYSVTKAKAECKRYIQLLRKTFGDEPFCTQLAVKGFNHDFGYYYEVVCWFDDAFPESVAYAYKCEGEGPEYWEEHNDSN